MATKKLSREQLQKALDKINSIYSDFQTELARLKAERIQIIDRINKKADDKKIQEILRSIK
jgi:oligoendopeptidase F